MPSRRGKTAALDPLFTLLYGLLLASLVFATSMVFAASMVFATSTALATPTALASPTIGYDIVARYPHRSAAFTQGLELADGWLYESSGLYGKSFVARWRPDTDDAIRQSRIPRHLFGEGLTLRDGKLYVLSWRSGTGLIIDATTLRKQSTFRYSGEGWGLTHDEQRLIMSNGSSSLRFLDPTSLQPIGTLAVTLAVTLASALMMSSYTLWQHSIKQPPILYSLSLLFLKIVISIDRRISPLLP